MTLNDDWMTMNDVWMTMNDDWMTMNDKYMNGVLGDDYCTYSNSIPNQSIQYIFLY